jgi:GBP family porin
MNKTLLALAAIAASSASFAQSSVTLYGVVDASVESVKGDKTVTRVSSDNLSTSRFGLKGVEDMGDGLKAKFVLESGLKADTGAADSTRFFNRAAWVGVAGGFGEARLGRQDSAIGDIAGNVLSAQPYDDLVIVGTRAGKNYRRVDNTITYLLPALVPGLDAQLQYSTAAVGYNAATGKVDTTVAGGEAAGTSAGKAYGLSIKYAAGPLSAGIGYLNAKDENTGAGAGVAATATTAAITAATVQANGAGSQKANATLGYVAYDFGLAKVTAYYDAETNPSNAINTTTVNKRLTVLGAKVAVPFSPEFTLVTGLSTARNVLGDVKADDNVQIITIKGIYSLSKRTSAYAMFTNVNNDTNTTLNLGAAASKDKTTHGLAVGIRHAF